MRSGALFGGFLEARNLACWYPQQNMLLKLSFAIGQNQNQDQKYCRPYQTSSGDPVLLYQEKVVHFPLVNTNKIDLFGHAAILSKH